MLVSLWFSLLLSTLGVVECQVMWPDDPPAPDPPAPDPTDACTASNGEKGFCYEFRTSDFKECSFYQGVDTSNTENANHLTANICKNTGRAVYFCCPSSSSGQHIPTAPEVTTPPVPIANTNTQRPAAIPSEEECGISFRENVVGGEISSPGDWPWLAALGSLTDTGFRQFCGGTLVTKQHVITAAHCFNRKFENTVVRLGEYDINVDNDGAVDFKIVDERTPNYDRLLKQNDIRLLKLDRPLTDFTDSIRAACLPYHLRNDTFVGRNLTVVGWGRFSNNVTGGSPVPIQANVPVVPIGECKERYKRLTRPITNKQLCAGEGIQDSCSGDSGGPINYLDFTTSRFYVVGLTSFGPNECGDNDRPGVYTRFGYYLDWIEESIRQLS